MSCSLIGYVKSDKMMHIRKGENTFALLPADFVAHAPLLDRKKTIPKYLIWVRCAVTSNALSARAQDILDLESELISQRDTIITAG